MIEVVEEQEQEIVDNEEEMVEAEEVQEPEFMILGEPSEPMDVDNILRRVEVIQRKRKFHDLKRKGKIARGEIIDDDSGDEEEEDEDKDDGKADNKPDDKDDKGNDDNDQGGSGLLIREPVTQERIDELLNDEINELEDEA
ncbi:trigger factor-like [Helianthus annuus]|uniref:trigger factor-like n=1 Tax=Helianthus annuus TaxID=4232 RepID=UPI000B8F1120|nr:trigger factor-like [Helianthus annuus]